MIGGFQVGPFQTDYQQGTAVVSSVRGGTSRRDKSRAKKVLRRLSDLAEQETKEIALEALAVVPVLAPQADYEDDDDKILLAVMSRVLH